MSSAGKTEISPVAAAAIIIAILLVIGLVAGIRLRQPATAAARAGSPPPAPPAVQKQNQQFLTALESVPPGRRLAYVNQQLDKFQGFMSSATMAQREEFTKDVKGQ